MGWPVAVAAASGGDGCARASSRERASGGEREQRVRERGQGLRAISVASLEGAGEAGGGQSRVEVARTAASRCPRPSGEEEDDREVAVAGWAVLLGQVGYQVSVR